MRNRTLLVLCLSLVALVLPVADAHAATRHSGNLKVNLEITSFRASAGKTTAQGVATATLSDSSGGATKIRQPVSFAVKSGGSCRILSLVLNQLDLNLLGLRVHLAKVNLQVTGQRSGGVLGNLFCKLANSRVKARVAAARALTRRVGHKPIRPLAFSVPVRSVTAAQSSGTPACHVLTLILGPLNLNLLGLVVDLNKVDLVITAQRGQGKLGDIFCDLADNNSSG
jgi:hypothetical protein